MIVTLIVNKYLNERLLYTDGYSRLIKSANKYKNNQIKVQTFPLNDAFFSHVCVPKCKPTRKPYKNPLN